MSVEDVLRFSLHLQEVGPLAHEQTGQILFELRYLAETCWARVDTLYQVRGENIFLGISIFVFLICSSKSDCFLP